MVKENVGRCTELQSNSMVRIKLPIHTEPAWELKKPSHMRLDGNVQFVLLQFVFFFALNVTLFCVYRIIPSYEFFIKFAITFFSSI